MNSKWEMYGEPCILPHQPPTLLRIRLPAAEPHSIAGFLFPSQYLSGMIWLTPYLIVWDWRVSRAGPMPFCWPSCSLLFCLQLFSLSLFLYRLVVWGWGLRTDGVSISLSRLALPIFFNNNNDDNKSINAVQYTGPNTLFSPSLMIIITGTFRNTSNLMIINTGTFRNTSNLMIINTGTFRNTSNPL